ncbi:fungal-specific transcription factor domain-domain-containing protein [Microdochium bolleyi]|uniref:Fungal-specific transcription factor domain-domain-containing protein n=1 Tax=Microdochium bolleyi TaxID=196109 RepID=A0A136IZ11_9PEZI|nr:fungal-specific transcription factor domain-domain-containing protein [Microdochium bolleyi]
MTDPKVKRRAARACTFCRMRKIKCNAEEPTCANCKVYAKDCVYEPITETDHRPQRASRPRQHSKDAEPASPRPSAPAVSTVSPHSSSHPAADAASEPGTTPATTAAPAQNPRVARIVDLADGGPSYHGRTSALFEESGAERAALGAPRPVMSDDWIEKGLVADATKQRQLEEVNYRLGRLDFDGLDPELGMHLLSLHWNRQHHSFLVTYRPAFMRDMACAGPYFSKLLLNAIYFGASKFSPRTEVRRDPGDVRTAGWKFRERVRELLGLCLDRSSITTIQALLIMTNSLFALGDERSAAWLYAGIAFRMIVDLGMHVDASELTNSRRGNDEDLEIRRRVFWGAFVVDKIQSLYQGRPVTLKESDTLVPIKFLDSYEELEYWKPFAYTAQSELYPGSPAYSVSTFTALCRLSIIMSDILSSIYTERSFDQPPQDLRDLQEKMHDKLSKWKGSLPEHLSLSNSIDSERVPPPHVFSLHAMYHVLLILLHRPFVADGHLFTTIRTASINAFMSCASAASEIVRLVRIYHQAFSVKRAPYLISYATYVAATIHVRIAASRDSNSGSYTSLETCLAVFMENQETNSAVQRASAIVKNLMTRFGVTLPEGHTPKIGDAALKDPQPQVDGGAAVRTARRPGAKVTSQSPATPRNDASPGTAQSGAGSFDIDQIIQSFNTRTEAHPYPVPAQWRGGTDAHVADQHSGGASAVGMGMPSGLEDPSMANQQHQQPYYGYYGWPTAADSAFAGQAGAVDDPLFGFNGAALDQFSHPGMFYMGDL